MVKNTQTVCLVVLTTIAIGASLDYLESVLLPFVIALFVVIGCRPILEFVEKTVAVAPFLCICCYVQRRGCVADQFFLDDHCFG